MEDAEQAEELDNLDEFDNIEDIEFEWVASCLPDCLYAVIDDI
jgi:hypothetical protein